MAYHTKRECILDSLNLNWSTKGVDKDQEIRISSQRIFNSIQPRFNNLSMRIEVLKGSIESELKAREQPTFGIAEKIAEPSVKLMKQTDLKKI